MGLVQRVLTTLDERRKKILAGNINCIPSPFENFQQDFPGVEQGKMYLISGGAKSGKTQLTNFLFLYNSILFAYYHPDKIRLKVFYMPLEETPEKITIRFMCHLLHILSGYRLRISPMQLQSTTKKSVVDESILKMLDSLEYRSILDFYEDHVTFLTERNPTGFWKKTHNYALEHGVVHKRKVKATNNDTGITTEKELFDFYEPNDPEEYVIEIIDHISLVELERGLNLKQCIDKLTEYCMIVRNHYNHIPVIIQQQNSKKYKSEL